jgi:rSAM/selenodomain-associated transferase 2
MTIAVVIPTLDAEPALAATLSALVPAAVEGLVRQVIVVDGGSTDRTLEIADAAGAEIVKGPRGRGHQLAMGAERARWPWLLFLHADTVLQEGWEREAAAFMMRVDDSRDEAAAAFRFVLDDTGLKPRLLEAAVAARCALFRLPYGDQGLLIPRRLYLGIGGYRPLPLMEDVDLVRRLGRRRIRMLRSAATTGAERYRRDGYAGRVARNLRCLLLFYLRVPPERIARMYEK